MRQPDTNDPIDVLLGQGTTTAQSAIRAAHPSKSANYGRVVCLNSYSPPQLSPAHAITMRDNLTPEPSEIMVAIMAPRTKRYIGET